MKLKVKNTTDKTVVRLGFIFTPGTVVEVEVKDARQRLAISAVRGLEVEDAIAEVEVELEVQPKVKKDKKEKSKE